MRASELGWRLVWPWRARADKTLEPGSLFPDFELAATDGRRYRLSEDGGKRTVLWFTNLCDGCQARAPLLNQLVERSSASLRVLAVNILEEEETASRLAPSFKFPILLDPEDIVQSVLKIPHPPGACPLHNLYVVAPGRNVLLRGHLSAMKPESVARLAEL